MIADIFGWIDDNGIATLVITLVIIIYLVLGRK